VRAEAEEITALLRMAGARVSEDGGEQTASARWCEYLGAAGKEELLVRVGVPPQHLRIYWQMLSDTVRTAGRWFVDVASGMMFVRQPVNLHTPAHDWVEQVRQPALALRGYAVVQAAPESANGLDRCGYRAEGADVAEALQRRWDPAGILRSNALRA
jgi:D-lactate dehydrogenase (cytochrome)